MGVDAKQLSGELKALCKRRGLSVPPRQAAIRPAVRAVCGITDDDDGVTMHRKVVAFVRKHADELPRDLRTVALAAFGLLQEAQGTNLTARIKWLEKEIDRGDRTVRRWIEDATQHLARLAVASTVSAPPVVVPSHRWRTERLRVFLLVKGLMAEAFVSRRIVAEEDGIAELDLSFTLTAAARPGEPVRESDVGVDVFHGGLLVSRTMESSERIGLALRLPAPLNRGQRHEFVLRIQAKLSAPHYVSVLRQPCDEFDLRVRFDGRLPQKVGRLEKIFQDDARDSLVEGTPLELDASGALHTQFRALEPGFAYGVRWTP